MGLIPDEVRVVYFDAVGTLLFPDPPVAEAYHAAGRRYGSRLTLDEVRRGFHAAFAAQEALDARLGNKTNADREQQRWRTIVADTFPDIGEPAELYRELWVHFGLARNWRLPVDGVRVASELRRRGSVVGIASNFDRRLINLLLDTPFYDPSVPVMISELIGWRKPAPEFFAALCNGHRPNQVLLVGDDRVNDYDGARAAGMHAVLLDDATTLTDLL